MPSRFCVILPLVLLLLAIPCAADAQFYRQNDSIARIIKGGGAAGGTSRTLTGRGSDAPSAKKRKPAKRAKKKTKTKKSVKKTKQAKPKKQAVTPYAGVQYRLGDRVIMRGDSGVDVRSLANILIRRLFLDERDVLYTPGGKVLYDGAIIRAVRTFQKVSGIYEDGIVGTPTLKALRKRD